MKDNKKHEEVVYLIISTFFIILGLCFIDFVISVSPHEADTRSDSQIWCEDNGGQYFHGGFGASHCQFLPSK